MNNKNTGETKNSYIMIIKKKLCKTMAVMLTTVICQTAICITAIPVHAAEIQTDVIPDELEQIEHMEPDDDSDNNIIIKKKLKSGINKGETYTKQESEPDTSTESQATDPEYNTYNGPKLTKQKGVNYGPTGKETYYNLDMSGVVSIMRGMGFSEEEYPYWERSDGCKMLGNYIMVAADLNTFPRGSVVQCSLGEALVCDTGGFAAYDNTQLDIATNW